MRNYFGEHKKQYEDAMKKVEASKQKAGQAHYSGPAFILGARSLPQFSELLASLPGRDAVDKMVGSYFNDFDPSTRRSSLYGKHRDLTIKQTFSIRHHGEDL